MAPTTRTALRVSALYGGLGILWITLSDQALALLALDASDNARLQLFKGWLFVGMTTVFLFVLAKHHLKRLHRRESHFRKQLDALPHIVWHTDASGRLLNISGAYSRLTGISLFSATPDKWMDALHPDDKAPIAGIWERALGKGETYVSEFRMRMADGSYRFFESQGTPIVDDSGTVTQWIGTVIDVHERKQAELDLVEKEANLRLAVEGGNIGFWDWNISAGTISFSRQWKVQLGLDGYQIPETLTFFQRLLHPDDFDDLIALKAQIEANPKGRYCVEYRIAHADGSYRWMLSPATIIEDESGKAVRLLGANIDITERKQAEQQLAFQASHDDLLQLPNRRRLRHLLNDAVTTGTELFDGFGLILIDIDDFKSVNDSIGHSVGDKILRVASERIASCLGEHDVLCRPDGDEFAVIVRGATEREALLCLAHRIQRTFDQAFTVEHHRLFISITLGVSLYPDDAREPEQILRYADAALRHGKHNGKNCVQLFDPMIAHELREWSQIKNALQTALQRNELDVVFQPQVELANERIVAFEALARWTSPELGPVSPERFIPVAEASGMIDAIGHYVLTRAIALVGDWTERERACTRVAVNISARQLHLPWFAHTLKELVHHAKVPPACIELEITETGIMQDIDTASAVLNELTEAGFLLTIDDFGTGYSSLRYLQKLRVNALKIDRSFIQEAASRATDAQIVEAVVALAHNLNMAVVAEGLETAEHVAFAKRHHCDLGQGYYYSKPVSATAAMALLRPPISRTANKVTPIGKAVRAEALKG